MAYGFGNRNRPDSMRRDQRSMRPRSRDLRREAATQAMRGRTSPPMTVGSPGQRQLGTKPIFGSKNVGRPPPQQQAPSQGTLQTQNQGQSQWMQASQTPQGEGQGFPDYSDQISQVQGPQVGLGDGPESGNQMNTFLGGPADMYQREDAHTGMLGTITDPGYILADTPTMAEEVTPGYHLDPGALDFTVDPGGLIADEITDIPQGSPWDMTDMDRGSFDPDAPVTPVDMEGVFGPGPDPAEMSLEDQIRAWLEEQFGGPRDTSEDEALIQQMLQEEVAHALRGVNARAGRAGFGTSGALGAMSADAAQMAALAAADRIMGVQEEARKEALAKAQLGLSGFTGLEQLGIDRDRLGIDETKADTQQTAFMVSMMALGEELGWSKEDIAAMLGIDVSELPSGGGVSEGGGDGDGVVTTPQPEGQSGAISLLFHGQATQQELADAGYDPITAQYLAETGIAADGGWLDEEPAPDDPDYQLYATQPAQVPGMPDIRYYRGPDGKTYAWAPK